MNMTRSVSFPLSLSAAGSFIVGLLAQGVFGQNSGLGAALLAIFLFLSILLSAASIIYGIRELRGGQNKDVFSVLGLSFSVITLVSMIVMIGLGFMVLDSGKKMSQEASMAPPAQFQ